MREHAIRHCVAHEAYLQPGVWAGNHDGMASNGIGLLVLDGLLIRRVGIDGGFGAELLGQGDLLRPWQGEDALPMLPRTTGWRVLEPTRLAVLDIGAAKRLASYPELTGRIAARALERSRNLAINLAIVQHRRIGVRLEMFFWHLSERWGRVRPDGVILPLQLTHAVLAELVCARRPTVSGCLSELAARGLVRRLDHGWLLAGEPPSELLALQPVSIRDSRESDRQAAKLSHTEFQGSQADVRSVTTSS
jgi:CRP-like cAMP-binding protein